MIGGIIVDSLGYSQLSYQLTKQLNKVSQLDEYMDIILFYTSYDKSIIHPKFAMMQEHALWGFEHPVIATSLFTAQKLISCPSPRQKYFYVWDLEWTTQVYKAKDISDIYMNEDIKLVARSTEHFKIIKDCWKEPVGIIEDFNYEQIANIIKK